MGSITKHDHDFRDLYVRKWMNIHTLMATFNRENHRMINHQLRGVQHDSSLQPATYVRWKMPPHFWFIKSTMFIHVGICDLLYSPLQISLLPFMNSPTNRYTVTCQKLYQHQQPQKSSKEHQVEALPTSSNLVQPGPTCSPRQCRHWAWALSSFCRSIFSVSLFKAKMAPFDSPLSWRSIDRGTSLSTTIFDVPFGCPGEMWGIKWRGDWDDLIWFVCINVCYRIEIINFFCNCLLVTLPERSPKKNRIRPWKPGLTWPSSQADASESRKNHDCGWVLTRSLGEWWHKKKLWWWHHWEKK